MKSTLQNNKYQKDKDIKKEQFSVKAISKKAMALHSSTLAWKIPWTEQPGELQSMGSQELDTT